MFLLYYAVLCCTATLPPFSTESVWSRLCKSVRLRWHPTGINSITGLILSELQRPLTAKILPRRGTSVLYWETWACAIWVVPAISNPPLHFSSKYVPEPPRPEWLAPPLGGPRPCGPTPLGLACTCACAKGTLDSIYIAHTATPFPQSVFLPTDQTRITTFDPPGLCSSSSTYIYTYTKQHQHQHPLKGF
jgi:hypothetical protein